MKKLSHFVVCCMLCAVCCMMFSGCGKKKDTLFCTKYSGNGSSEYTISFENKKIIEMCSERTYIYATEELAKEALKTFASVNIGKYELQGSVIFYKDCHSDFPGFDDDRGTLEKEKLYFENEGYNCRSKDA